MSARSTKVKLLLEGGVVDRFLPQLVLQAAAHFPGGRLGEGEDQHPVKADPLPGDMSSTRATSTLVLPLPAAADTSTREFLRQPDRRFLLRRSTGAWGILLLRSVYKNRCPILRQRMVLDKHQLNPALSLMTGPFPRHMLPLIGRLYGSCSAARPHPHRSAASGKYSRSQAMPASTFSSSENSLAASKLMYRLIAVFRGLNPPGAFPAVVGRISVPEASKANDAAAPHPGLLPADLPHDLQQPEGIRLPLIRQAPDKDPPVAVIGGFGFDLSAIQTLFMLMPPLYPGSGRVSHTGSPSLRFGYVYLVPNSRSPASPRYGDDVGVGVQLLIKGGAVDLHVRVLPADALKPRPGSHNAGQADVRAALVLQNLKGERDIPPVANMRSSMMTVLSAMSWGSLQ